MQYKVHTLLYENCPSGSTLIALKENKTLFPFLLPFLILLHWHLALRLLPYTPNDKDHFGVRLFVNLENWFLALLTVL